MSNRIELPLPPSKDQYVEMDVYARFMQHLRRVPHNRMEIKILSAIQFTADMMGYTDAQISKMLVDMGLRVGRVGLPMEYLDFADASLMRSGWEVGGPTASLAALKGHWDEIGEDKFAAFRREYALVDETNVMGCV
ncbi:MAG: hypothetical protein GW778_01455 [Alphaproteobacteria bacterium]|nr:hypothetical protein [Alphaproteobacteria bacterium]